MQRWADMLTRGYKLDESQKQLVLTELRKMQADYYATLGPIAAELDRLEGQLAAYWSRRSTAGERPRGRRTLRDPELVKIRERIRELRQAHPFDIRAALQRIESLLLADQVAAAQQRREERRTRLENRRQARRTDTNRERRRPSGRERPGAAPPAAEASAAPLAGPTAEHPWRAYARTFAANHGLTASQRVSVGAIVKEMIARESAYRTSKKESFAEADRLADPGQRAARLQELESPVSEMFAELKMRLDGLLTAEQRDAAP